MKKFFTLLSLMLATITVSAADIVLTSSVDIQAMELKDYGTVTIKGGFTLSDTDLAKLKDLVKANNVDMLDLTDAQFADNTIPAYAFSPCADGNTVNAVRKLVGVTFPKSVTTIDQYAFFRQGKLHTFVFPEGCQLETIKNNVFQDCVTGGATEYTAIEFPASLKEIGNNAFRGANLTAISFAEGTQLTRIGDCAFINNKQLTTITLPASLTTLAGEAFRNDEKLTTVTFDESAAALTIGANVFNGAKAITTLKVLRTKVPTVQNNTFDDSNFNAELTIPEGTTDSYKANEVWAKFTNVKTQVVDAIGAIEVKAAQQGGAMYNLAGQRVGANAKGLVIVGGKKIAIK